MSSPTEPPASSADAMPITKSQFKLGLDCIHKLRHARRGLPQISHANEMLQLLSEGGAAVEALIRANEPGPLLADFGNNALVRSHAAIHDAFHAARSGTSTSLYEATIQHGGFLARIDLLRIGPEAVELLEIKSKSVATDDSGQPSDNAFLTNQGVPRAEWLPYLQDLAFQRELLRWWLDAHLGTLAVDSLPTVTPKLLLIAKGGTATEGTVLNRDNYHFRYESGPRGIRAGVTFTGGAPDRDLVVEADLSRVVAVLDADAGSAVPEFAGCGLQDCMARMRAIVDSDGWPEPRLALGPHCKRCEFRVGSGLASGFDLCWGVGSTGARDHILTLTRLTTAQCTEALRRAGPSAKVLDAGDHEFNAPQRMQVASLRAGGPVAGGDFARAPLMALRTTDSDAPIWFVDFETAAYPIPSRVGGRPYEHVPFQFEGHGLPSPDASLDARVRLPGFLELIEPDPRRRFIEALMIQFPGQGPIFHWHRFERTVLEGIRATLRMDPESGDADRLAFIDDLIGPDGGDRHVHGRLIDLLPIARQSFYHPDLSGSYSIKRVVPIAWAVDEIRSQFLAGHNALGDPDVYSGMVDPYDDLPPPPRPILEAVGGIAAAKAILQADDHADDAVAVRNGGMAMLAYHHVRMFGGADDPAIEQQFRQYCRLDSAAMVMVYALMRDHVHHWRSYDASPESMAAES